MRQPIKRLRNIKISMVHPSHPKAITTIKDVPKELDHEALVPRTKVQKAKTPFLPRNTHLLPSNPRPPPKETPTNANQITNDTSRSRQNGEPKPFHTLKNRGNQLSSPRKGDTLLGPSIKIPTNLIKERLIMHSKKAMGANRNAQIPKRKHTFLEPRGMQSRPFSQGQAPSQERWKTSPHSHSNPTSP